jgi:hypothetical protein
MIVPVYWGTRYTSTTTQHLIKQVTCEKCGCPFAYELVRQAAGMGSSAYNVGNQGAQQRAQQRAQATLNAMLANDEDPVPCPRCGWFQQSMVRKNSRFTWLWTPWGGGMNIDPNRDYPQRRGRFPGMPIERDLSPGADPQPLIPMPDVEPNGIVTPRLLRDPLPSCCCQCLAPATLRVDIGNNVDVLMCADCHRKNRRSRLLLVAGTILVPALLVDLLFFLLELASGEWHGNPLLLVGTPIFGLIPGGFLGLLFAGIVWIAYGQRHCHPALFAGRDAGRMTMRLRFHNAAYVQQLREHIAATRLPPLAPPD